jgi:hypothetical protein
MNSSGRNDDDDGNSGRAGFVVVTPKIDLSRHSYTAISSAPISIQDNHHHRYNDVDNDNDRDPRATARDGIEMNSSRLSIGRKSQAQTRRDGVPVPMSKYQYQTIPSGVVDEESTGHIEQQQQSHNKYVVAPVEVELGVSPDSVMGPFLNNYPNTYPTPTTDPGSSNVSYENRSQRKSRSSKQKDKVSVIGGMVTRSAAATAATNTNVN